jgi:hypothetical protein
MRVEAFIAGHRTSVNKCCRELVQYREARKLFSSCAACGWSIHWRIRQLDNHAVLLATGTSEMGGSQGKPQEEVPEPPPDGVQVPQLLVVANMLRILSIKRAGL